MSQYPAGGAIFKHEKKTPQSPQMDGYVEIDEAMLSDLAMEIQQSPDRRAKLQLAMWTKESKKGEKFFSVKPTTETARAAQRAGYSRGRENQGGEGHQQSSGRPAPAASPLDDEIPFHHKPWSFG